MIGGIERMEHRARHRLHTCGELDMRRGDVLERALLQLDAGKPHRPVIDARELGQRSALVAEPRCGA